MSDKQILWCFVVLVIAFLGGGGYAVKTFLYDDSSARKSNTAVVTLMRPPPPAEKERPREPLKEIRKKEEIVDRKKEEDLNRRKEEDIDSEPQRPPQNTAQDNTPARDTAVSGGPPSAGDAPGSGGDNAPAGDTLGLDADGTAGSDGFGLVARKGGRSITAGESGSGRGSVGGTGKVGEGGPGKVAVNRPVKLGDGGSGGGGGAGGLEKLSLLSKFGWYTQIVKTEVSKTVQRYLEENGRLPKGKLQTTVRISVDTMGMVVERGIIGSSGSHEMDEAVKQSLHSVKISEPPPDGMPRTMILRITSQS